MLGGGGEGGVNGDKLGFWKKEEALSHCDLVDHVSLVEQVALTMKASTMRLKPTSLVSLTSFWSGRHVVLCRLLERTVSF